MALLNWIREARKMSLPKETPNVDADRLVQPIPDSIATDEAKVALGHDLFFDGRLSGDGSIQCHTCHQLDKGGVDRLETSTGIEGKKVQLTHQPYSMLHLTLCNSGMVVQQI